MMFLRIINVVVSISTSLLFMAKWYPIVWINHILFIILPVNVYLRCSHFFTIVNNAAMNISVQVFVEHIFFISLE